LEFSLSISRFAIQTSSALPWSAVIHDRSILGQNVLHYFPPALINGFTSFDSGGQISGMADHIGIGKIQTSKSKFSSSIERTAPFAI